MKKTVRLVVLLVPAVLFGLVAGFRLNAWLQESKNADELVPVNGEFVSTEFGKIHVSVWGDRDGIPVVMTHGMAAWGGLWTETAERLAEDGYRVYAVDQPPFGFSEREGGNYSRSRQALRLRAFASAINLKDYILVGHSYGGGIAMETALVDEENVGGIILVCPVMKIVPAGANVELGAVPIPLRSDIVAQSLVSLTVTNPFLTGFLTKQFMHRKDLLTAQHVDILQRPMKLNGNTKYMVEWLREFLQGDPNAKSRQIPALTDFGKPVVMIWGEEDTVTPIYLGEELEQILKPLAFHRMNNTGHMPQLEAPEEFGRLLLDGLDSLKGRFTD